MAKVAIVSDKDFKRLKELMDSGITVIIPRSLARKHPKDKLYEVAAEYTCGDEADCWVDLVDSVNHYFISEVEFGSISKTGGNL